MIRKWILSLLLLFILITMYTFRTPIVIMTDIKDLSFIRTIGIDKSQPPNDIRVSITSKQTTASQSTEAQVKSFFLHAEGKTIFEAVRRLSTFSDTIPFWTQTEYLLVGEEAAMLDFEKYIDFFLREQALRIDIETFIVKNATAEKAVSTTSTKTMFTADRLSTLVKQARQTSLIQPVNIQQIVNAINQKHATLLIPCIEIVNLVKKEKEDQNTMDILLCGYAVFKEGQLIDYIDNDLAKAYNIIHNQFQSDIYVIESADGHNNSLEIIDLTSKTHTQIDDSGQLTVKINIRLKSNIGEHMDTQLSLSEAALRDLESKLQAAIKTQIENLIEYSQKHELDMLNIWNDFYHQHPNQSKALEPDWQEILLNASFNIEVDALIRRSYNIKQVKEGDM